MHEQGKENYSLTLTWHDMEIQHQRLGKLNSIKLPYIVTSVTW